MHSPAPWTNQKAGPWVLDANGREVVSLSYVTRSDAALIKAAPDMLQVLQYVRDQLPTADVESVARIDAVIQKATNEERGR